MLVLSLVLVGSLKESWPLILTITSLGSEGEEEIEDDEFMAVTVEAKLVRTSVTVIYSDGLLAKKEILELFFFRGAGLERLRGFFEFFHVKMVVIRSI